ncbi:low affinity immunoglobulin epsilon Fc receptor-like [Mercenaria mercenaria]|uniref:low affinity immunoglobulin epsilon Fc receptor-like n=1 Tax=Mercenaria mercenaria TaxID=6596 RepID=UPI00234E4575|nr:low affinity immunoglobulin epsilon Fc receptor-like [Mercenaria mercenaria]
MDTTLRGFVTSVIFLLVYFSIKCKATVCPNSFNLIHGKCIQYNNNKIPWSGARSDCRGKGGDLISITSQAIYQELKTYCERSNRLSDRVLWVGAEEKGTGTFRWFDGRSCCGGWWAPNEPNGNGGERCVHYVDRSDGKGAALNDGKCGVSWAFVCESPACNSVNHCVEDNQECTGLAISQHRCKNCTQSYYSAGWGFGCKAVCWLDGILEKAFLLGHENADKFYVILLLMVIVIGDDDDSDMMMIVIL